MTTIKRLWWLLILPLAPGACSSIHYQQQIAKPPAYETAKAASPDPRSNSPHRKIAIFFDGTANNVESDTNVKRLHSLVSLQNKPEIATLYIEGVGVDNDLIGAGTGRGFRNRVALAYSFLLANYHAGDRIYLFGFSRGAYQARALASMLYYVGLPDAPEQKENSLFEESLQHAMTLFDEMKEGFHERRYPCSIAGVRAESTGRYKSRRVEVLGLWDTVEALGGGILGWSERLGHKADIKAFHVDIDEPNDRYGDQLWNVNHVFHAVSLDDDREWIFTPLLTSRQHLLSNKRLPNRDERSTRFADDCPSPKEVDFSTISIEGDASPGAPNISEVWFAGAHSDVGGGYVGTDLPGVSLNWMIGMLEKNANAGLLPRGSEVREDPFGSSHDPEAGMWSPLYHNVNRNLAAHALGQAATCGLAGDSTRCGAAGIHEPMAGLAGKLCVHESVFQRRRLMPPRDHENTYLDLLEPGPICVRASDQLSNPRILRQAPRPKDAAGCPSGTRELIIESWQRNGEKCPSFVREATR